MMHKSLMVPLSDDDRAHLRCGEQCLLTGMLYTARDAAHKRFADALAAGKSLPVNLSGQILYYTGPTPPRPGMVIGSAGPTTSSRMDRYTPSLIEKTGLAGIIGKGNRGSDVIEAFKRFRCCYFAATGGAGALLGSCIRKARVVCYRDLGPEAVFELEVVDFPVTVAIDTLGGNCYVDGPAAWRRI